MKKLSTIIFFLLIQFYCIAQLVDSASAVIHFDSSTIESVSGIVPTVSGNYTYVTDHLGNPNSAIKLSAQLDYGNPQFSRMDTTDFTIAFWFRKDGSLWQEEPIIEKRYLALNPTVFEEYTVFYNDWIGAGSLQIGFHPTTDSNNVRIGMTFSDSTWHHIAVTFDRSDSMSAYLNGQFFSARYIGNLEDIEANIDSATLKIGSPNMSLDEIYFFKKALNTAEIKVLYDNQITATGNRTPKRVEQLTIFPNPNNGIFKIKQPENSSSKSTISIYNAVGQVVFIKENIDREDNIEVNLSNSPSGIYFITLTTETSIYNGKVYLY